MSMRPLPPYWPIQGGVLMMQATDRIKPRIAALLLPASYRPLGGRTNRTCAAGFGRQTSGSPAPTPAHSR